MDRRYFRQYENFDTIVPRAEDFPVLNKCENTDIKSIVDHKSNVAGIQPDDLILLGVLILLLFSEEKDMTAIIGVAFLLLSEYIF